MDKNMCDKLLDYYNGSLEGEEKKSYETHLNECMNCQDELKEWQELTEDLPYLSEEIEPPLGMKKRIMDHITKDVPNYKEETVTLPAKIDFVKANEKRIKRSSRPWLTGLLAAALLLSLGTNAYLWIQKNNNAVSEEMNKTFKTVELASASRETQSNGVASMVKENGNMRLVIQTHNMKQVKGNEAYQVWLIEGDKKYRAGTFVPDENGNGAVVFPVNYPGEHKWDTIAISHEPTPKSKQPKGAIVMASKL